MLFPKFYMTHDTGLEGRVFSTFDSSGFVSDSCRKVAVIINRLVDFYKNCYPQYYYHIKKNWALENFRLACYVGTGVSVIQKMSF